MPLPSATVVIPCFNYGVFVREAVDSALAQQGADIHVVVVDDGSDDGISAEACDRCAGPRVEVIHQANQGLPHSRNVGARHQGRGGSSEYLVFLDADDTLLPHFVSGLHETLTAASGADGPPISHAYGQQQLSGLADIVWKVPEWDPILLLITNLHPPTTLVRRAAFEDAGGFDPSFTVGYEDWELWIRMMERGYRAVRRREPVYIWRRHSHETMITRAVRRHDELYLAIMDKHRATYERHAADIIRRCNSMLRTFDCNWLDESGFPISLQYLWSCRDRIGEVERDRDAARRDAEEARRSSDDAAAVLRGELEACRHHPALRLHARVKLALSRLPGPVENALRTPLHILKRVLR